MIKHISFDLWMTLIRSHPQFKMKRAELIAETYAVGDMSAENIDKTIRKLDKIFDRYNELGRRKIPADEMYRRVLEKVTSKPVSVAQAKAFRERADRLFMQYPPQFLNDHIPQMLHQLVSEGYVLNLASNTGFVEGATLRQVLSDLGILNYFSFSIFSDEVGASKPSSYFFQRVYDEIGVPKHEVLHVGDNPKTDYQGARSFGFAAYLLPDADYTVYDIMQAIDRPKAVGAIK